MYCKKCGKEIDDEAVICVHCGCAVDGKTSHTPAGAKNWTMTYMLAASLGFFGAHRFYTGHIGSAVAQLLTLGGCGIWYLIDLICIQFNKFRDDNNRPLDGYYKPAGMFSFAMLMLATIIYIIYFFVCLCIGVSEAASY